MSKILWVDTETTGLSAKDNGLTEVACIVEIDGVIKDKLLVKINPFTYSKNVAVEDEALKLTNKSTDILKTYGDSLDEFSSFIQLLDKYIDKFDKNDKFQVAGYNVSFDIEFIRAWFKDNNNSYYGSYFTYKDIDVFAMVKHFKLLKLIGATDNDQLKTICEFFAIPLQAHNALDDIVATKELYKQLVDRYVITNDKCCQYCRYHKVNDEFSNDECSHLNILASADFYCSEFDKKIEE